MRVRLASFAIALCSMAPVACASFGIADRVDGADGGDAGAPTSSGADASVVDAGNRPPSACERPPGANEFFCRTFDEPALASPFGFDELENPDQGQSAIVAAPERRGNALRITLDEGASSRNLALVKHLTAPASRYVVSFDLRVARSSLTYGAIGALHLVGPSYAAFPGIAQYRTFMSRLAPAASRITLEVGRWYRIRVEARFTNGALDASTFIDDQLAGTEARPAPLPSDLDATFKLGCFYTGGEPGSIDMFVDDLQIVVE